MSKIDKKILIVEDDKDLLKILQTKFAEEGFSVVVAGDGQEGVTVAEKEKPDLIISDILMPKLGGLEMAKKIKGFNGGAIIMFLTNTESANGANDAERTGEFEYLIKAELKINDIIDRVKTKLKLK